MLIIPVIPTTSVIPQPVPIDQSLSLLWVILLCSFAHPVTFSLNYGHCDFCIFRCQGSYIFYILLLHVLDLVFLFYHPEMS